MKLHSVTRSRRIKLIVLLVVVDSLFFGFFNPITANPLITVAGSALLILTTYVFILGLGSLLVPFVHISEQMRKRAALFITMLFAFFALMNSIGQLGLPDILAAVPLVGILYVYLTYISTKQEKQA